MNCAPLKNAEKFQAGTEAKRWTDHSSRITLREFLAGHVLRTALFRFEDAMGPWVKGTMRQHFPDDPTTAAAANLEEQRSDLTRQQNELSSRRETLQEQLKSAPSKDRAVLCDQKAAVESEWHRVRKQLDNLPASRTPTWIRECHKGIGHIMKPFVKEDTRWDTHVIVSVMRAHLRDIFSLYLEDHFHAKELLSGIIRVSAARTRRAHRETLVEADVLDALLAMQRVLEQCQFPDAAHSVSRLLANAKELVHQARTVSEGEVIRRPVLSFAEAIAQTTYIAISSWEKWVENALGQELMYKDGTITFGQDLDPRWATVIKGLHSDLQTVAVEGRHWYFHHIPRLPDLKKTFGHMMRVVRTIHSSHTAHSNGVHLWNPPPTPTGLTQVDLVMSTPAARMTPPIPKMEGIVGRDDEIAKAVQLLLKPMARVLIHGLPGMGKDVVMAEVAHDSGVQELDGIQMWLQASSEPIFRRQLIQHFATHRPQVVEGLEDNTDNAVAAIKRWLSTNTSWLMFVEDANLASKTLWEILPRNGSGRLLMTSQAPLQTNRIQHKVSAIHLKALSTDDSIELLRQLGAFANVKSKFRDDESEDSLRTRCETVNAGRCYIPPTAHRSETSKSRKTRCLRIEARLSQENELSRPELSTFLKDVVGNLPLTVALCGNMVRANPNIRNVHELIEEFRTHNAKALDTIGLDRIHDRHYFGLFLSTKINLDRLRSDRSLTKCDRTAAVALLAAVSMLDRALTPKSFFETIVQDADAKSDIFNNSAALDRAQEVCIRYGFFQSSSVSIGIMHQQVQRCLRTALVTSASDTQLAQLVTTKKIVTTSITDRLTSRSQFSRNTPTSVWPKYRQLVPCVEAWCNQFLDPEMGDTLAAENTRAGCVHLLNSTSDFYTTANGDALAALPLSQQAVVHCHNWRIDDCASRDSMSFLAFVYTNLGRHDDALELWMKVKETCERDLPRDHPDIALSMNNLAATYSALGRHRDALELNTETLKFRMRVLPSNNPHIPVSMNNLALTFSNLGQHREAFDFNTAALALFKRFMPPDHPDIASAMNNLALTYSNLGQHLDALELNKESLKLRKQVLPPNHPDIAMSMNNLALTYSDLGQHRDALELKTEALAFRKRVLPPDHPDIVISMNNLALTYSDLGRHQDALNLQIKVLEFRKRDSSRDHPDSTLDPRQAALGMKTDVFAVHIKGNYLLTIQNYSVPVPSN